MYVKKLVYSVQIILLFTLDSIQGEGGCRNLDFLDCIKNKALVKRTVASFRVLSPGLEQCQHKCFMNDACVSYNLGPVKGVIRTCELSDRDHVSNPKHVVVKEGFEYCAIKNPCSSSPCSSRTLCKPDFSSNSFKCIPAECVYYTELAEPDRNINFGKKATKCDDGSVIKNGDWYRFAGPAGSRMLDTCPKPGQNCNTDFKNWLQDGQPNPGEVKVYRTVCRSLSSICCLWPMKILTTNCGDFNVYQLKPNNCNIRYCGTH